MKRMFEEKLEQWQLVQMVRRIRVIPVCTGNWLPDYRDQKPRENSSMKRQRVGHHLEDMAERWHHNDLFTSYAETW